MLRMLTGLLALVRRERPDPDTIFRAGRAAGLEEAAAEAEAVPPPDPKPRGGVHGGRGMPEDRARFIAAFLERAFRGKTTSIFCHEDRPFPDIRAGGKVEDVRVTGSGEDSRLTLSLNHYVWFVDGYVDIELERDATMLRVETFAPCGAAIRLVFMPEGDLNGREYELWSKMRRALDREEYFGVFDREPPLLNSEGIFDD